MKEAKLIPTNGDLYDIDSMLGSIEKDLKKSRKPKYRVLLYNDSYHQILEVFIQLLKAIKCGIAEGKMIIKEVSKNDVAVIYKGTKDRCEKVCNILREINLGCEVEEIQDD